MNTHKAPELVEHKFDLKEGVYINTKGCSGRVAKVSYGPNGFRYWVEYGLNGEEWFKGHELTKVEPTPPSQTEEERSEIEELLGHYDFQGRWHFDEDSVSNYIFSEGHFKGESVAKLIFLLIEAINKLTKEKE